MTNLGYLKRKANGDQQLDLKKPIMKRLKTDQKLYWKSFLTISIDHIHATNKCKRLYP